MSTLALVRHAQASFFEEDYDRLSALGEEQARRLGDYWARRPCEFTEVYVGPRRRQQQTAQIVGDEYRRLGVPWPAPTILEELDEYDLKGLLERLAQSLIKNDDVLGTLAKSHETSIGEEERVRAFQRMFERLLLRWVAEPAAAAGAGVESWPEFRERVRRGLERITGGLVRGRRVVAFTSGGVIGAIVAGAIDAPDRTALSLSWRLRNASITNLLFTADRLTLDDFNTLPHLQYLNMITYR
jgi:broad specificity phosphatase PhoE